MTIENLISWLQEAEDNNTWLVSTQSVKRHLERIKESKQCDITDIIDRYSGEKLMKLQNHFVIQYGSDEMAQEKANSFAFGFSKACELMIKELSKLKNQTK